MRKEELRNKYRKTRLAMGRTDIEAKSRIISGKLLANIDWPSIKSLHTYKTITTLKEVDTNPIIRDVSGKWPQITVSVASSAKNDPLPTGKYELIIVPVLAFDKDNYRLGWGGGFYDKFLADQPQALKIGLCFQNGFVEQGLPREPHDIRLDRVITEL
jgi:5-formyltetrahydrofolate cyclo-ligase